MQAGTTTSAFGGLATNSDLLMSVFGQLEPTERNFDFLTLLACVCGLWKRCSKLTRSDAQWLAPFFTNSDTYLATLGAAYCNSDIKGLLFGMKMYSTVESAQKCIFGILTMKRDPKNQSIFKQSSIGQIGQMLPIILSAASKHTESFDIFKGLCRIVLTLTMSGSAVRQEECRLIVNRHKVCELLLVGIGVHNQKKNISRTRLLVKSLMSLKICSVPALRYIFQTFARNYKKDADIVREILQFWIMNERYSNPEIMLLVVSQKFVATTLKLVFSGAYNEEIGYLSCYVLQKFAQVDDVVLKHMIDEDACGQFFAKISSQDDQTSITSSYLIMTKIMQNGKYGAQLDESGVLNMIISKALCTNPQHTSCRIYTYVIEMLNCVLRNPTDPLHDAILGYGALDLITNAVMRYDSDELLQTESFRLLTKILYSSHKQDIIVPANIVYKLTTYMMKSDHKVEFLNNVCICLTSIVEKNPTKQWFNTHLQGTEFIFAALKVHTKNAEFQKNGLVLLEAISLQHDILYNELRFSMISAALAAIQFLNDVPLSYTGLDILFSLIKYKRYKKHILSSGGFVVILSVLKNTKDVKAAQKCLEFLSHLCASDYDDKLTRKYVRSLVYRERIFAKNILGQIPDIVMGVFARFPETDAGENVHLMGYVQVISEKFFKYLGSSSGCGKSVRT